MLPRHRAAALLAGPVRAFSPASGSPKRQSTIQLLTGFRPFVHRLAIRHGLGGWIRNECGEVRVEIEGMRDNLRQFVEDLRREAPPLARIDALDATPCEPRKVDTFLVLESSVGREGRLPVCPDMAI